MKVEIDFEKHARRLSEEGYSAEQIEIMLDYLWELACTFIEFGYAVHPVQQACGQNPVLENARPNDLQVEVKYPFTTKTTLALTDAVASHIHAPEREDA